MHIKEKLVINLEIDLILHSHLGCIVIVALIIEVLEDYYYWPL